MQKITPCLWFDTEAEEAISFYTSIFNNSKIKNTTYYTEEGAQASGMPAGSFMLGVFELDGQEFMALNGGPIFKFTEAVSFIINCETQEEIDYMWQKLSEGGQESVCGWLKDKFGLSWQVVPTSLGEMMKDEDAEKRRRVTAAVLKMKKLDIQTLRDAYEGK